MPLTRSVLRTAVGFLFAGALASAAGAQPGSPVPAPPSPGEPPPGAASLVAAGRAFARAALEHGVRWAFMTYLAEDGLLYRPGPVNGIEFYTGRSETTSRLSWVPVYAEVSRARDLGYTTGPWEFRQGPNPQNAAYVRIWRREKGNWKLGLEVLQPVAARRAPTVLPQ